ncbi:trigger factor [Streptomyces badius]
MARPPSPRELKGGSADGKDAEVTVKVTAVAARELPELDDDFAQMASEFDTLEELKADSRKRLETTKQYDQATQAQERVLEELLEARRGPDPGEAARGRDPTPASTTWSTTSSARWASTSRSTSRSRARPWRSSRTRPPSRPIKGIKTQFILDELVNKEKLNVNQEELTEHLMRRAASSGMSPDQFAQAVVEGGQVPMLVGEVARGKALAVVVEAAKVVDTNGEIVDLDDGGRGRRGHRGRRRGRRRRQGRRQGRGEDRGLSLAPIRDSRRA